MRKTKRFRLKGVDDVEGVVTAVIATLNVKDHDGDVTLPGAFGDQEAPILPTHDWSHVPLGKATISETETDVVARMKFNLELQAGRDWFGALKFDFENGKPLQEYSYGYDILEAEPGEHDGEDVQFLKSLNVLETSPVILGAGVGTRTLEVKSAPGTKAHVELGGSWELTQRAIRAAARKNLLDDGDADAWLGYVYIEATFSDRVIVEAYKEWEPDEWAEKYFEFDWKAETDGSITLSNVREVELDVVVRAKSATYADQFSLVTSELKHLNTRSKALAALRTKEGRTLSQANRDRLTRLSSLISDVRVDLEALLADTTPDSDDEKALEDSFLEIKSKIAGGFQ